MEWLIFSKKCVIMELRAYPGQLVNDTILTASYLGEARGLRYTSVNALTKLVREKGAGCALMKCDLKRAYKQIFVDPTDWNFLGLRWQGKLYFDLTMPMGLGSAATWCQRLSNAMGISWNCMVSNWWHIWMTWWQPSVGIKLKTVSPHYRKSLLPWEQWRPRVGH